MRCRELGNYLTKCLDIPAVTDDPEFRTFLGFPSNFMNLKARAYSVMPDSIDHGEGDDNDVEGSSSGEEGMEKPPMLKLPPEEPSSASSSNSNAQKVKPVVPAKPSTLTGHPKPPTDEDGIAMFDYAGTEPGELAFKVGEIVHMIESEAPRDWAAGYTERSTADKPGYFPRCFVRPFTGEDYIYNSTFQTWSLRDDISNFTYDPATSSYTYTTPPRVPAQSLYK